MPPPLVVITLLPLNEKIPMGANDPADRPVARPEGLAASSISATP